MLPVNRRQFVALVPALLGSPLLAMARGRNTETPLYLSAASDGDDRHWVIGFTAGDEDAQEVFKHPLPGRAHHIAVHEGLGIYIVIARRPGAYLWIGDLDSGEFLSQIKVPANRHLYGHGVFTRAGSTFFTTENAWQLINGDSGRVVAWDVARQGKTVTMTRNAEFPSYGTGPHELLLKADQKTLVVANGGIRTHPDRGREILNLESMLPSLTYIHAGNGALLEQHFLEPDYHKASIRHLDQNAKGQIVMGMQYEGEPFDRVPLLAVHEQGSAVRELWAPDPQQGQMSQYVGSVRFDGSGRYFAASCPRGNMITFWNAASGEMQHAVRSRDGCGICATEQGFVFTAGTGRVSHYDPATDRFTALDTGDAGKVFWDNHLSRVSA